MSDNVRVCVRVRPLSAKEAAAGARSIVRVDGSAVVLGTGGMFGGSAAAPVVVVPLLSVGGLRCLFERRRNACLRLS